MWLTKTAQTHVAHWGVYANSSVVKGKGRLAIEVTLENLTKGTVPIVRNMLIDPQGKVVGESRGLKSVINVSKPMLWSCETPYIYIVRTEVIQDGRVVDTYETGSMPRRASGSMARTSRSTVYVNITISAVWVQPSARMPCTANSQS